MVGLALEGATARADQPMDRPSAVEVDRSGTPPGRTEMSFDAGGPVTSGDAVGWAMQASFGFLERPIVVRSPAGEYRPVARRATLGLGAAVQLGAALVVDARAAAAWQTGDRLAAFGTPGTLDRWVARDVAFGARVRVVDLPDGSASLRGELTLPTGDDGDLAGEASWGLAWSLIGRLELGRGILVAGTAGIRLRGAEVRIADRVVGDELFGAAGVLVPVPVVEHAPVRLLAEVVGVMGNHVGDERGPSPVEARGGAIVHVSGDIALALRAGRGLDAAIGSPGVRLELELTYRP